MKVAVIGGGASGLTTAYLLRHRHAVTLFEKQAHLGGNIRTLNRNIVCERLPSDVVLDNGVLEFEPTNFPTFAQLMTDLGVTLDPFPGHSGCYLPGGEYLLSPAGIFDAHSRNGERLREMRKLLALSRDYLVFLAQTTGRAPAQFHGQPVARYLRATPFHQWMRLLLMYAYSIPFPQTADVPAELALPMLRQFLMLNRWVRIRGGVYTYVEKILQRFTGTVVTHARIRCVQRTDEGVRLHMADGETLAFDKVVLATTPDRVLPLLQDPSDGERRRFGAWEGHAIRTAIHTDVSIYNDYPVSYFSEFDVFRKNGSGDGGYNAYLNRIGETGSRQDVAYCMSYNLEDRIDPHAVIDVQEHWAPLYTVEAFRHRHEITATNGERHTFHAGAYLGNGLHEGALASAVAVARLLDGQIL